MTAFRVSIYSKNKSHSIEFNSVLDIGIVELTFRNVVKQGYRIKIKEIEEQVQKDRTFEWALDEALTYRFYHNVCKIVECTLPYTVKSSGTIKLPTITPNSDIIIDYKPNSNGDGTLVSFMGFVTEEI